MPRVSIFIPCYRLGHLLADCVNSILSQSYEDLEILIMDDCSPDETPQVAATFRDPRVRYIRNDQNLGHLRNYNKAISLCRGDYIWLISADDRLRRPYVVERFVAVMDARPDAGYVFCPAMKFEGDRETELHGFHGAADSVFDGREFLHTLVKGNSVPAPAGMVRRSCYEHISLFPLDMPFAGDWYLWSAFALSMNVAYIAEPMVSYRVHAGNMTLDFKKRTDALVCDELRVLWGVKALAESARASAVARLYLEEIAWYYATHVAFRISQQWRFGMSLEQFDESLDAHCPDRGARAFIRSRTYSFMADQYREMCDVGLARHWYRAALIECPTDLKTRVKLLLLRSGIAGRGARRLLEGARPAGSSGVTVRS
jgi:glycosyltransferase involved in cell wall biosynthesis